MYASSLTYWQAVFHNPVLFHIVDALEACRQKAIYCHKVHGSYEYIELDEVDDYFCYINEPEVNEAMARHQHELCNAATYIFYHCEDVDHIRHTMSSYDAWPRDSDHLVRLICLYTVCQMMNDRWDWQEDLSRHELLARLAEEQAARDSLKVAS